MADESSPHQDLKVEVFDHVLKEDYLKSSKNRKKKKKVNRGPLIGSIDQGTSSTRFVVFSGKGRIVAYAQSEHTQHYPNSGWHEHDPLEIWEKTVACVEAVGQKLSNHNVKLSGIGLTNQRETTIAWNKLTGVPYHNAIVWDDTRTASIVHEIAQGDNDKLREKTGLPLASYFAGTKVKWLLDNVPALQKDVQEKPEDVALGTIDSWLLYQLTGTPSESAGAANCGGIHLTDVTNASRWLFMDLSSCKWDQSLVDTICSPHSVPLECLPQICPSTHSYETCSSSNSNLPLLLDKVPLAAVLGDQQAALFGQTAYEPGEAKNTYGTGLFLMMNTGNKQVASTHGLLTTVGYKIGDQDVVYALEGSVSHSGSTIQWLRDQLKLIPDAPSSETEARTTSSNEGCYLVPAFAGLFCPHWRDDARACLVGLTAAHGKGHVCRAALEAAAYQTYEVFQAMQADANVQLSSLRVDGGGTHNGLMMQFQSDILGVDVIQPTVMETTALGAAFGAGLQVGVWKSMNDLKKLWSSNNVYSPSMEPDIVELNLRGWRKAIGKSLNWVTDDEESSEDDSAVLVSEPPSPEEKSEKNEGGTAEQKETTNVEKLNEKEAVAEVEVGGRAATLDKNVDVDEVVDRAAILSENVDVGEEVIDRVAALDKSTDADDVATKQKTPLSALVLVAAGGLAIGFIVGKSRK